MNNFNTKIDNDATSAGVVVADEYNSIFNEAKNAISPFIVLDSADNKQLQKAIDIASKATFYTDTGTANSVVLSRGATAETTETLFDGMVVIFTPAFANTGATTLKINTLLAKDLKYNALALTAGLLQTDSKYIAIYSVANNRFDVDLLVNYKNLQDAGIDIASTAEAQAGTDNTKAITASRLHEAMLGGVSQSRIDVKTSRAFNTVFTNLTGRPITVDISINVDAAGATFKVNSNAVGILTEGAGGDYNNFSIVIQANDTYELTSVVSYTSIIYWTEIR